MLALAPRLLPVPSFAALFGVALAGALGTVPVEAVGASVGHAVALSKLLVPLEAGQAFSKHLHAAARADVESPVFVPGGIWVSAKFWINFAVNWQAHALTPEFIPVLSSRNTVYNSVIAAGRCSASAFAS